jgi:hypothetical protein
MEEEKAANRTASPTDDTSGLEAWIHNQLQSEQDLKVYRGELIKGVLELGGALVVGTTVLLIPLLVLAVVGTSPDPIKTLGAIIPLGAVVYQKRLGCRLGPDTT